MIHMHDFSYRAQRYIKRNQLIVKAIATLVIASWTTIAFLVLSIMYLVAIYNGVVINDTLDTVIESELYIGRDAAVLCGTPDGDCVTYYSL